MSSSVGVVILARYSSSRLPGKALKVLAGDTVLGHIVNRLTSIIDPSQIVLATSDEASDDALETFARERDIRCYRGSLTRVGERFEAALRMLQVDYGIRINGDNLFLDPDLLNAVISECNSGKFDFISNVLGRTFPKGMSVEAVRHAYYLDRLPHIKVDAYCNEHVMVCLYDESEPENHKYIKNTELPEAAGIQLALDTPNDWNRSVWMMENMPNGKYDLKTTFEYAKKYEAIVER
ncbi:MAG: hypothetical protein HWD92_08180 [Flavobacteriia bacterium]|nr:hypothetical protein [Flavobacteriia bacterium]